MLTEISVKYIRYTRSHKSGNIHGENLHRRTKKSQNILKKKNYTTILRTDWVTKHESRSESEFWVTCRCLSDTS